MSKILFIGDVHLTPRTPASRKDDYQNTLINKLRAIKQLQVEHKVEHVVFLGDIFNTNQLTLAFFTKVFSIFKEMSTVSMLHTVIGNHDILYNTTDTIQESPIQLLREAGVLSYNKVIPIISPTQVVKLHLFDYTELTPTLEPLKEKNIHDIFVGHYFYAVGFDDVDHTITKDQCRTLGYDSYILGHDHTVYDPVITKEYQVHRPGSLTRGTTDSNQIKRELINVILFDTDTLNYKYINLPGVQPIKDIFVDSRLLEKVTLSEISDDMQVFLDSFDFNEDEDLFEVLNSMPIDKKIKDTIVLYLNKQGKFNGGEQQ